jgi:hypothetical protein
MRTSAQPGRPSGSEAWVARTPKRLGLKSTLPPRGRLKGLQQMTPDLCSFPVIPAQGGRARLAEPDTPDGVLKRVRRQSWSPYAL